MHPLALALLPPLLAAMRPIGLSWHKLPPLPLKVSGAVGGVSGSTLIVGGGCNFPDAAPWQGGHRRYYDDLWLLPLSGGVWRRARQALPVASAYGMCAGFGDDVIVAGGNTPAGPIQRVFRLRLTEGDVSIQELTPLPVPLCNSASAVVGRWLFLAGGQSRTDGESLRRCWVGEDQADRRNFTWSEIEPWPGPARHLAVGGASGHSFYLLSGMRSVAAGPGPAALEKPYLRDAYVYTFTGDPRHGHWARLNDLPRPVAAAPGQALGDRDGARLWVLGGLAGDDTGIAPQSYPPFANVLSALSLREGSWKLERDAMPGDAPRVTAPAISWRGGLIVIGGEIGPGRRTDSVYQVDPARDLDLP